MKHIIISSIFLFFTFTNFAQFSEAHIVATNAIGATYVHTADLNGNGFMDVIVASIGNKSLEWYQNLDGLGNFGAKQVITELENEYRFAATADLDNDGDLDIITTALFDNFVVWFKNIDGQGTFSDKIIIDSTLDRPQMLNAGDIDNDGDLDLVCPSSFDNRITWFENIDGLGNYIISQTITTIATTPRSLFLSDFDDDGDLDLVSDSSSINNQPAWHENLDGLGEFSTEQVIAVSNFGTQWVIADDLDGDNDNDIITVEFGGDTIAWFKNTDGLGTFGTKQIITTNVDAPYQVVSADIDNDGYIDLVYVSGADSKIAWQKNDGFGNFEEQQIIALDQYLPKTVAVADFDGDGYLDVVTASIADFTVAWYKNQTYLGVEENSLQNIILAPNPTKGLVTLHNNTIPIKTITIYDIVGKIVGHTSKGLNNQINLSNLKTGIYLIHIKTSQGVIIKKIIKE